MPRDSRCERNPLTAYGTREQLRRAVIDAFAAQEEVYRICVFGREAEGKHDRYSDIDMVIYSSDPARTKSSYRSVFASVSPIRATLTLGGTADSYCEMVMLHGYSPYQKVDFSIGNWGLRESRLLEVYTSRSRERTPYTMLSDVQIERDAAYVLTDVLFSVARFTKCLFRRDIDMYRRWESITDLTLALLYEELFGWERVTQRKRLDGYESKRLCEALRPEDAARLHRIRPPHAKLDLAASYQASLELLIDVSRQKARHFQLALDEALIAYIRCFVHDEIERYERTRA